MSFAHTVKTLTTGTPVLLTGGVPRARAGDEYLAISQLNFHAAVMEVRSPAFENGQPIPATYSAQRGNISPPIEWLNIPGGTRSLALIVEDPDAPLPKPFVHWIVYNIRPDRHDLPEGIAPDDITSIQQGKNSNLKPGWTGMAPPKGDTPHHYHFQLFALDQQLLLDDHVGRTALLRAIKEHVIAKGDLVGTYQNP